MNLFWVNGIGIPLLCFLVFISISKCSCTNRTRNRRLCHYSVLAAVKKYARKLLIRKCLKSQYLPFMAGFGLTILFSRYVTFDIFNQHNPADQKPTKTDLAFVFQSSFDQSATNSGNISSNLTDPDESRIWLVISTTYSLTQAPSLTRIAQAIFPVRQFVTLVLVKHYRIRNGIEHLSDLDSLLRRFSIPFVLLSSHQYKQYLNRSKLKLGSKEEAGLGLLTGIAWVLQDVQRTGILMMGHEEYSYNSVIFNQIRETKKLSSWPVAFGLNRELALGLTSPILAKDGRVEGYFDGNYPSWETMPIEIGAFALNIEYFRKNGSLDNAWKLAFDSTYYIRDLGFGLQDVQPLGNNCSEIFVWRTKCRPHSWPEKIKYKEYYKQTNMDALMRSVFGIRFPEYVQAEMNFLHF